MNRAMTVQSGRLRVGMVLWVAATTVLDLMTMAAAIATYGVGAAGEISPVIRAASAAYGLAGILAVRLVLTGSALAVLWVVLPSLPRARAWAFVFGLPALAGAAINVWAVAAAR